MRTLILSLCLLLVVCSLRGQVSMRDSSVHLNMLHVTYRPLTPIGEMNEYFGLLHGLGFEYTHKFPSNWALHGGINVIADGEVKVSESFDVLQGLRINGGLVINDGGTPTIVRQRASGFLVPVSLGRVIPVFPNANPNSGLYLELGAQFLQHNLRFEVDEGPIAALRGDSKKAYDLLTSGIGLRQEIGYMHLSNNGYLNFRIGLDLSQSLTQNRRSFNAWTGGPITDTRLDLLAGLRVSWIFLVYKKAPGVFYY